MKKDFRQSMTWLHAWSGLVFCWVIYFMFVTGTLGYFDNEIDQWMKPEIEFTNSKSVENDIDLGIQFLSENYPDAQKWYISPTSGRTNKQIKAYWRYAKEIKKEGGFTLLNNITGKPIASRDTQGGQVLYKMHYQLHYLPSGIGYKIIGILTMLLFIGLITGIVAHRKIFKDFFAFRPEKGKTAILDLHNLSSIASLPFQLMITYSGLIFIASTWMSLITTGAYQFDSDAQQKSSQRSEFGQEIHASGQPAKLINISSLAPLVEQEWGKDSIYFIEIKYPFDESAYIIFNKLTKDATQSEQMLIFNGVSGQQIPYQSTHSTVTTVSNTFINLHEGEFAGISLRWLYFFSGILGCVMIASGAIQYAEKRRRKNKPQTSAQRYIDIINLGTIIGLPLSIAAYFIANRMLPLSMDNRAEWEVHCMFATWAITFIYAAYRPITHSWKELSWVAAIAFSLVPIINALTTQHNIFSTWKNNDWDRFYFDICCLVMALIATYAARTLAQKKPYK
ncbi:PepSY domain-containing protein [Moritella sp. 28]|uniref:PepSY-associated TM helix domain-containing protein n=1 Tax=Moritella sp. 28 TaxID=2746232 RepID=UPI001BA77314|nr:PepSY-associated TM helix domain-containing protein [Moritella sp. 28]QUM84074.1 PepSY domain-containing protein [Moritella sp. 28]